MATAPVHFFDPPTSADQLAALVEEQASMAKMLAVIPAKNPEDVKMVAAALKSAGTKFEKVYLDWAQPYGRFKAKGLWAKVPADPDAMTEVLERHLLASTRKARFKPQTAAELDPTPMQYLIKGVAPAQGLLVIYGPSGSAKSFLSIAAAAAIGEGSSFFGYAATPAPVLYVGLEGEAGVRGRVLAWERHHGRPMPDNVRFSLEPFQLTDAQDVADLAEICPPGCAVIIDTLNRAAPGLDENSSKDMGRVIDGAKTLQRKIAGLVILVAHSGKDSTRGLRGHSSLFAALDAAILVSRGDGGARRWKLDKAKDGKDGEEHGFRLTVVELGTDADGDTVSSCVIEPDSGATRQFARPLKGNRQLAFTALENAARASGILNERGEFVGVTFADWYAEFFRISTADNKEAKRKAFARAREDLAADGHIEVDNDIYRFAGLNASATHAVIASILAGQRTGGGQ
ncbi:MAG: hypothetical protein CVU18_17115 [Betaproteobacteria bacterium HGW-Betaproteobacteria-12]|nr:MAG: hypothetical protein CVU18_17115 [Betaproteobacteria bacterium HGW-Betaproteobacteria-12]